MLINLDIEVARTDLLNEDWTPRVMAQLEQGFPLKAGQLYCSPAQVQRLAKADWIADHDGQWKLTEAGREAAEYCSRL